MKRKNAFTLVELLVVITIIGILSSLITVAVGGARRAAKRAAINMELSQISNALELYKKEFGEYPPDLSDNAAVLRHVKKRWPRFNLYGADAGEQFRAFLNVMGYAYRHPDNITALNAIFDGELTVSDTTMFYANTPLDPTDSSTTLLRDSSFAAALPFWFGGFPNNDGVFAGFSADPVAPFGRVDGVAIDGRKINTSNYSKIAIDSRDSKSVFMEMTLGKNVRFVMTSTNNIVFPCLVYEIRKDLLAPYVYFRPKTSGGGPLAYLYEDADDGNKRKVVEFDFGSYFNGAWKDIGQAVPYAKSGDPFNGGSAIWYGADTYQLIHPGLDGIFGFDVTEDQDSPFSDARFRSIKTNATNNNIGKSDFDNLTNFSGGNELKTLID